MLAAPGDDAARIRLAFEIAHGRVPEEAVVKDSLAFLKAYRAKAVGQETAWAAFSRVLLTSNAFLFVD